ncbi:MAG: type I pullulanase [Clostridia bacterium]|nr:type I pullulanase [Clostridia bacterium]
MVNTFNLAGMIDFHKIQYSITPKCIISALEQVKVFDGDRELKIIGITNIGSEADTRVIEVEEALDISRVYRVIIDGFGEKTVVPTSVFDTESFIKDYTYDGKLGAIIEEGKTTFKLWAPTASKVVLNLFNTGHEGEAYKTVDMIKCDRGVWSYTEDCGHGTYYTYTVTTAVGTQEAVDPYAKSVGLNGNRGMVVDLSKTNPDGWTEDNFRSEIKTYSDAIIWEVHVRDFSNKIADSKHKGKYLAFTERGLVNEHGESVGVDYLVNLGVTHVHLLPVYDYATVDEANPDSEFNWGYDPKNYDSPEGSYSTNPYDGEVRIREYKEMVMALHKAGIAVVMDMVYNHTYSANSSFNKIVPYYYYRFDDNGENISESGCGNDTASERYMYGKFMVDSTGYWVKEYKLDGLRFDLMGMHDLATMQRVEKAVHSVNPKAIIYGEGWDMGKTIDGSARAMQKEISKIVPVDGAVGGIAVFNDVIRDGLKGSVFIDDSQGYISGDAAESFPAVLFGIKGGCGSEKYGWQVDRAMVVNYMSAHDNNTLWDKLAMSNGNDSIETRFAMNRLGATILMISRGAVFFQAGEEMLRSKPMGDGKFDENSYKSSDAINNIRWDLLKDGSIEKKMSVFYKGLIEMRKAYPILSDINAKVSGEAIGDDGRACVSISDANGNEAFILLNPTADMMIFGLDKSWNMVCNGEHAGKEVIGTVDHEVTIPSYSAVILVNDKVLNR